MRSDYERADGTTGKGRPSLALLILPLVAFVAGLAAMGWLLARWGGAAAFLGVAQPPAIAEQTPPPVMSVVPEAMVEDGPIAPETQRLVIDPEITRRVNRIEERVAEIDNQSRAAVGNADRAEGLLVAFAARRAIDRGVSLGYLEGLLRQRFGERQRQAVAAIITASRDPVTLGELQAGLEAVAPQLTGGGPDQGWWTALRAEMGGLITVRKAGTPSTMPAERLSRAMQRLEAGQVDVALAEIIRMPARDKAAEWIGLARRYVGARRALDMIETAALLEPHMPAEGNARLTQPARPAAPSQARPKSL